MVEEKKAFKTMRMTESQNEEMKKLLRQAKEKTGKKAAEATISALRYYIKSLDSVLEVK